MPKARRQRSKKNRRRLPRKKIRRQIRPQLPQIRSRQRNQGLPSNSLPPLKPYLKVESLAGDAKDQELLQHQLHHHSRLPILIISVRPSYRPEPILLINPNHPRIPLAAIRHNPPERIPPRILNLPFLDAPSQPTPAITG